MSQTPSRASRSQPTHAHQSLVGEQFGARAKAYLDSAVHARGQDLDDLVALARGRAGARALDMGCGGGHAAFALAPHVAEIVACDLSPEMLAVVAASAAERGLAHLSTRQCVAESLPFDDACFDLVASRYSAHHWSDMEAGVREAARVLKPGGTFAMIDSVSTGVPLFDTFDQAIELLRDISHVRNYSRAEWHAAIARAGLDAGATTPYRVALDFGAWITRMATPPLRTEAIRDLQVAAPEVVRRHFAICEDGSFTIDVALFVATKPG